MSGLRTLIGSFGRAVRRPRLRHLALIAVGFVVASSGVAYAYLSATGSGTYGLAKAGALDAPALTVASHTPTSATLTWTPPSNPTDTTWTMTETGNLMSGGSCAEASPSPTCTVSGLAPGTTYHFQLTYTLHNWSKSSNTATVTTTAPPKTCGGTKTASLADGKTYTFTLLGGGGGKGGSTGGAAGGAGSVVHGSFTTPASGTVNLVYKLGCAGAPGTIDRGGAGGNGYATGGRGGNSHTTLGSPGGGGGGGGASGLALQVNGTSAVIAVVGGGGGGGGGIERTNKNTPQAGIPNTATKTSTTAVTGQNGKIPSNNGSGGMGTGAGGGGAGTQAPSGGTTTGGTTTAPGTAGKTAGEGGTGGYNFTHSNENETVTGVTVKVTGVATGNNSGEPGSFTLQEADPPSPLVSPAISLSAPTVTMISPATGPIAGGTQVTVTGTGFSSTATVSFGTDAATNVTVKSSTELVATSPAHSAGPVDVVVTDATGTSATSSADVFTYVTSQPSSSSSTAPTVTGITPASGPAAGGTTVTITGTGFTKTTAVSFETTAASVTFTSSTTLSVVTPAHASGTVTVTVTTSGGSATAEFTYAGAPSTSSSSGSLSGGTSGGTS